MKPSRRQVMLTDRQYELAKLVGHGNHSEGLRTMIERYALWLKRKK